MDHGLRGLVDYVLVHTPVPLRPDSPATGRVRRRDGRRARARLARRAFHDAEPVRAHIRPVRISYHDAAGHPGPGAGGHRRATWWTGSSPTWHDPQRAARRVLGGAEAMSFTAEVKDELVARARHVHRTARRPRWRRSCASRARCSSAGRARYRVEVATDVGSVARLIIKLLHEHVPPEDRAHGAPQRAAQDAELPHRGAGTAPSGRRAARHGRALGRRGGLELGIQRGASWRSACCAAAYLRGAFPGQRVRAPTRGGDFHFEVTVESGKPGRGAGGAAWRRKGINARVMQRRSSHMVYLKSGAAILEFLAFTGAHQCALAMENARVVKSVRNDVNRMTNAEMANQAKSGERRRWTSCYAIRDGAGGARHGEPAAGVAGVHQACAWPTPDATLKELGRAREPAPVQVGGLPPRPPHRADGERVTPLE